MVSKNQTTFTKSMGKPRMLSPSFRYIIYFFLFAKLRDVISKNGQTWA